MTTHSLAEAAVVLCGAADDAAISGFAATAPRRVVGLQVQRRRADDRRAACGEPGAFVAEGACGADRWVDADLLATVEGPHDAPPVLPYLRPFGVRARARRRRASAVQERGLVAFFVSPTLPGGPHDHRPFSPVSADALLFARHVQYRDGLGGSDVHRTRRCWS